MKHEFPLTGKWQIDNIETFLPQAGWKLLRLCEPGEFIWQFIPEPLDCEAVFNGTLSQSRDNKFLFILPYFYLSETRELFIDRSDYEPDGFCWACVNDIYRLEPLGPWDFHLRRVVAHDYDLHPDIHPEDKIRLKIRRIY